MPVSCDPQELITNSTPYCCITVNPGITEAVKLYLMAQIAGLGDVPPEELVNRARCFLNCIPDGAYKAVNSYLLCQAANGGSGPGTCEALSGANSPVGAATPEFIGQLYHETGDDTYWRSTGLTDADWVEISGGSPTPDISVFMDTPTALANATLATSDFNGVPLEYVFHTAETQTGSFNFNGSPITSMSFQALVSADLVDISESFDLVTFSAPLLETMESFSAYECDSMVSFSLPELTSVVQDFGLSTCDLLESVSCPLLETVSNIYLDGCPALTSISMPLLETVSGSLYLPGSTALVTLSLPALVTAGSDIDAVGCTSLTTVSLPVWVPTNTKVYNFSNCALTAASVNHILARAVSNAGYVAGTINTSGGTSAAPSGQGIVDKATLIGRGCTITTN